jgi:hypothetical protein
MGLESATSKGLGGVVSLLLCLETVKTERLPSRHYANLKALTFVCQPLKS